MRDFDNSVGAWCKERNIAYTRYCDDMTFSGDFDPREVKRFVKAQLRTMGFFTNDKKTVVVRSGQKQTVTGIVVNERPNISAAYRRKLRQELYYCRTYGVGSHMERIHIDVSEDVYLRQLLGRVNYVLSVASASREMHEYKNWLQKMLKS
jgi:retron-type reverse transcriptase